MVLRRCYCACYTLHDAARLLGRDPGGSGQLQDGVRTVFTAALSARASLGGLVGSGDGHASVAPPPPLTLGSMRAGAGQLQQQQPPEALPRAASE